MDQKKIGEFIKNIRLEHNLTQKEFADELGVTFQAVSKWETGKNVPDIGIMKDISKKYNVNIDEILNGKKQVKTPFYVRLIPIVLFTLGIILITLSRSYEHDFTFKTISSKCEDFKITGSAAYNKDKASIYISSVEFCGKKEEKPFKQITCTLYEIEDKIKTEISTCKTDKEVTLEEYLETVNISVNDNKTFCKRIQSSTLVLEIYATTQENQVITYNVPLKLNDNC